MSEYVLHHSGSELDRAINKVLTGYIKPEGTMNISANGDYDVREYENVSINIKASGFSKYYTVKYTPSSSSLELSKTFSCGFRPKMILIVLNTDTTVYTTNALVSAYFSLNDVQAPVGVGLYRLGTTNRFGVFGGGITSDLISDNGFTFNHKTIGFMPSVAYTIHVWG